MLENGQYRIIGKHLRRHRQKAVTTAALVHGMVVSVVDEARADRLVHRRDHRRIRQYVHRN